jgi:hypothetical protein
VQAQRIKDDVCSADARQELLGKLKSKAAPGAVEGGVDARLARGNIAGDVLGGGEGEGV